VRELGINLITFTKEENYVKAARFMDWYIVDDPTLWVNMELNVIKKENIFAPKNLVIIASHFAAQQEGSQDFYDFVEFQYNSDKFQSLATHDLITLVYTYYSVHAGTKGFLTKVAEDLVQRLDRKVTTYDLLRVLQAYSEISQNKGVVKLFI